MAESFKIPSLDDAFKKLSEDPTIRSKTGVIETYYQEIEAMKSAGIPNFKIVACLNAIGIDIGIKVFESLFYRIRKRHRNKKGSTASADELRLIAGKIRSPPPGVIENPSDIRRMIREGINLEDFEGAQS